MRIFACRNFDPVVATNAEAAARVFSAITARDRYGKRGYCHHVTREGGMIFKAFIGRDVRGGGCQGVDHWFTLDDQGEAEISTQEVLNVAERDALLRESDLTSDEVCAAVASRRLREGSWTSVKSLNTLDDRAGK